MNASPPVSRSRLPEDFWSNLALFALPAMAITVPSGSAYPALLLVLAGLAGWLRRRGDPALPASARWLFLSFLPLAACWLIDDVSSGLGGRGVEKPLKILLTLPALWYLAWRPPAHRWLWPGISAGVLVACAEALYQVFLLHQPRASGAMFSIHFDDLAMMFGLMSLCAWHLPVQRPGLLRAGLLLTCLTGVLASLLSGTRGAWLASLLPLSVYLGYLLWQRRFRPLLTAALASMLVLAASLAVPGLHVQQRVALAIEEIQAYRSSQQADTSVGARAQMWGQAWRLYTEKPLLGWQHDGYLAQQQAGIASGKLDPLLAQFDHPHNEFLNAAAKQGTLGVLALLLVYAVPGALFVRCFRSARGHPALRAVAAAGMLVPLMHAGFGLTETYLPHNSPSTIYFYLLCLLWGAAWRLQRRPAPGNAAMRPIP